MNDASRRDQIIRYLDLAVYHHLNHPDSVKEFYFVLVIDTEKPPWILTRYRHNQNLIKGLTKPGLFKPPVNTSRLLSKGLGWLSWRQLKEILEITREKFRAQTERKFVVYLYLIINAWHQVFLFLLMDKSKYFSFDNRSDIYYKCITLLTN